MRKFICTFFTAIIFTAGAFAQKLIKAKDAHNYMGKTVTIIGKIESMAGPGYLSSISYYLVTDTTKIGISVTIPMKIWRKSKTLITDQKGKTMKVTGVIRLNGEPATDVKNLRDVEIY
jgi:energy-converting hydrogenase Eha subunit E